MSHMLERRASRPSSRAGPPGSPFSGISMNKLALLILAVSLSLPGLSAQSVNRSVTNLMQGGQAQTPASPASDPLGRETPSGTVLGYLQAAQEGNYRTAADYLQMSAARRQSLGADLAEKLKVLMDRAFEGKLRRLSSNPDG